jgi:cytochrome c peroxidase
MVLRLLSKIQLALAQFISIQSFDSKYDAGRVLAANDGQVFANFTAQENQGKNLF